MINANIQDLLRAFLNLADTWQNKWFGEANQPTSRNYFLPPA